ncbi:sugar transferase [Roseibium denhamense]|nr:sugar transferase [Roseibium denhamense]
MRPGAPLAAARRKPQGWLKRLVDIAGAGFGLVLLAPLLIGIAAAIKLTSPGPVFFRQSRYGLNGMRFTIFKFRTMHVDQCDAAGVKQACANDPRITGIGKFLRRSNFDELPQLLNVLKGDMSLVGPRPHVPGMYAAGVPYEEFDKRYMERHQVRPGITGLAQVNGFRGETRDEHAARMRLEHDLDYIEKQSVQLDLKIIASTIVREFFKGNGY